VIRISLNNDDQNHQLTREDERIHSILEDCSEPEPNEARQRSTHHHRSLQHLILESLQLESHTRQYHWHCTTRYTDSKKVISEAP
jgi:ATP-dependent exoDNAse (exonuclease V) beta subunit